ncbi:hypothetical protein [Paenibacillus sp. FSL R7-0331]|uniref:hypothetical protein n=1 Tax=Paenibacillus sp. FSL R7-0331 TaxID=1536773 RepID=UPI0012DFF912|nr:hypothetical protein [Paenibacillus sp. FSL R7-0331]
MAENPCPTYTDGHHMVASLSPRVVDENGTRLSEFDGGGFFRCKGCGEYMVASGSPQLGHYVADYITQHGIISAASQSGIWAVKAYRSAVRYSATTTLPGYKFIGYN